MIWEERQACVVGFSVCGEEFADFRVYFISVVRASFLCHTNTAVRLQGTLEGCVCLEAHDCLFALVQIAGTMGSDSGNYFGVHIKNAACFTLFLLQVEYHVP